jgi:LuxR family maltose regulon positive regulatory protein
LTDKDGLNDLEKLFPMQAKSDTIRLPFHTGAMSIPLLATKLLIPPPGKNLVARPRLFEKLSEILLPGCRLGLITAPAGFGKTTLLSAWVTGCDLPVAWLTLDEGDNEPLQLIAYLITAIGKIEANPSLDIIKSLQSPQHPALAELLPVMVSQIGDISRPFVLALDDYHLINSPEIHQALTFIIEHQPPQMHLLIATRKDPPLPIPLLRSRGQLVEVRQADLRFTAEETDVFMKATLGADLSPDDVASLASRTEGWVAGLQMAMLSIQGKKDVSRRIASFSGGHEYIVDYFISEVLAQQPEELRTFLLQTSILDRLCGLLCDAVTGQAGGQQTLERLQRANLFVVNLDSDRTWFRYHHLFKDLLTKQLQQEMPEIVLESHRRASRWCLDHNLVEEAFEHAQAAGDPAAVGQLVDSQMDLLAAEGKTHTLNSWIDALSEEQRRLRPEIMLIKVMLLAYDGKISEASRLIQGIEHQLEQDAGQFSAPQAPSPKEPEAEKLEHLITLASVAHAWVASLRQDFQTAMQYALPALASLQKYPRTRGFPWLSYLYIALSNVYLQMGKYDDALHYLTETIELGKSIGNDYLVMMVMAKKVGALWTQGHMNQAAQVCQEGLRYIDRHGLGQFPVIDSLLVTWGFILTERGELEQAEANIMRGLELSRLANHTFVQAWAYQEMIRLLISKGDLDAAERVLQESASLAEQAEIPAKFVYATACLKIVIRIAQGRLAEAEQDLRSYGVNLEGDINASNLFLYLCFTRLLLVQGDHTRAEKLLDRIAPICQSTDNVVFLITAYKVRALLWLARNEIPAAVDNLERALELAGAEGYVQIFLDEGKPMARLLHEYVHRTGGSIFSRRLLAAFQQSASPVQAEGAKIKFFEPLSEREREVLSLLDSGLSNQEIAARLYLTLRTVKFHASNIYGKLGVKSRMEAVAKARALGLL